MAKLTVQTDEECFRLCYGDTEGSMADYDGISAVKDPTGDVYYAHFPNGPDEDPQVVCVDAVTTASYEVEEVDFSDEGETAIETGDEEEEEEEEEETV